MRNRISGGAGPLLRRWRERQRRSQLQLATDAEMSARHLSFVETGRAQPSPALLLKLAHHLDMPLRDRNALLLVAGYAPAYRESNFAARQSGHVRRAIELVLASYEPNPALAIDRDWNLVHANRAIAPLLRDVAPELLTPPINVMRLSLHAKGLAPRIVNLVIWRQHLLERLARQIARTGSQSLAQLQNEIEGYATTDLTDHGTDKAPDVKGEFLVPLELDTPLGRLSLFSTTTVFGTPRDVMLDEIAIESFFPADELSAERLAQLTAPHIDSNAER